MESTGQYDKESLRQELIRDEGLRLQVYRDSLGYRTIGVGHLLKPGEQYEQISEELAMQLLEQDIADAERKLSLIYDHWRCLNDVRQRALLNLTFNLGYKLERFRRFFNALKVADWDAAAKSLKESLWYRQVKLRGPRIVHMVLTGMSWTGK